MGSLCGKDGKNKKKDESTKKTPKLEVVESIKEPQISVNRSLNVSKESIKSNQSMSEIGSKKKIVASPNSFLFEKFQINQDGTFAIIIPMVSIYNKTVKILNKSFLKNGPNFSYPEFLDIRKNEQNSLETLKTATNFDQISYDEENVKFLRRILDFKSIVVLSDFNFQGETVSLEPSIANKIQEIESKFNSIRIKVKNFLLPKVGLNDFLRKFPILSSKSENNFSLYLPLMLFNSEDLSLFTKKKSKIKSSCFLIKDSYINEEEIKNGENNLNIYIEHLGISNIIIWSSNISEVTLNNMKSINQIKVEIVAPKSTAKSFFSQFKNYCLQEIKILIIHDSNSINEIANLMKITLSKLCETTEDDSHAFLRYSLPKMFPSEKGKEILVIMRKSSLLEEDPKKKPLQKLESNRYEEILNNFLVLRKELKSQESFSVYFEIMLKLIQNIIKNPNEDKFRTIKKSNQKLSTTVFSKTSSLKILEILGFHLSNENPDFYINSFDISTLKFIRGDFELAYKNIE